MVDLVPVLSEKAWKKGWTLLWSAAGLGWAGSVAGWLWNPGQFYASFLVAFMYFLLVALGAAFFLMVQHLGGAVWSLPLRRITEAMASTLPLAALLFLPLAAGIPHLYEWARPGFAAHEPNLEFKAAFFNPTFFLLRAGLYLAVWGILGATLFKISLEQDRERGLDSIRNLVAWSGPGLALLVVTVTMAVVDWLMSLELHWYSTIFGIYIYAGGTLAFLAAAICLGLAFKLRGPMSGVLNQSHFQDLGRWLFALTVFWAYIAFSQYMLIWYANLPEETAWFRARLAGSWKWVSAALLAGNFLVPFILLLASSAKRNYRLLGLSSAVLLATHYLNLQWVVMPSTGRQGFHLQWLDLATWLTVGSTYGLLWWRLLKQRPLLPLGDVRLDRALAHHTE